MSHIKIPLSLAILLFTAVTSFGQYFNNASNLESVSGSFPHPPFVWLNNGNMGVTFSGTLNPVNHVNGTTSNQVMGNGLNNKPGSGFLVLDSNQNLIQSYAWIPAPSPTSPANDYFFITKIVKGSDGYIYLMGRHAGLVDFDPGPGSDVQGVTGQSNTEGYVIKLTPAGSYMWVKRFSPAPNTSGYLSILDARELPNGNLQLVGDFRNTMDFDPGPSTFYMSTTFSGNTGYVMEIDTGANFVSAVKVEGATQYFLGNGPSGGKVIAGLMQDSANITLNGGSPVWLFKDSLADFYDRYFAAYDASDNLLWYRELPGSYGSSRFATDPSHNIYLGCNIADSAVLGNGSVALTGGDADLLIEKYDVSGNHIWSRTFNASGSQFLQAVTPANGALYILHTYNDSMYTQTGYGDTAFFDPNQTRNLALSIVDQDSGYHLASYTLNSDSTQSIGGFLEVKGDRVDFGITLRGPTDLDPGPQTATYPGPTSFDRHGVYVSWILDPLIFPVANDPEIANPTFDLYPNPGEGLFRIRFENTLEHAHSEVYDLQGSLLHQTQLPPGGGSIDLSGLPAGMYLLRLRIGNQTMVRRLVVQ